MSNAENTVVVVGNLTRDPELRYTTGGTAVCNISVAQTPRVKKDNGWEDGDTSFFDCSIWREYGENVAASLVKGQRVVVIGRMKQRFWEDDSGKKRSSWEVEVDECTPSLKWGTATFDRAERSSGRSGGGGRPEPTEPVYGDEEPF